MRNLGAFLRVVLALAFLTLILFYLGTLLGVLRQGYCFVVGC